MWMKSARRRVIGGGYVGWDVIKSGLLYMFEFNNSYTCAVTGITPTATGATSFVTGKMKPKCLDLNGGYLSFNIANVTSYIQCSISAWCYVRQIGTGVDGQICGLFSRSSGTNGYGWRFYYDGTCRPYFTNGAGSVLTADLGGFGKNTLVHVVMTNTNIKARTFFNGIEVQNIGGAHTLMLNSPTYIGYDTQNAARLYRGTIEQLGVWGRELTDIEIKSLYNQGNGLPYV